jgi:hypothetical protein
MVRRPHIALKDAIRRAIRQPLARSCRRYFRIAAFRDAARNTRRIRRQIRDACQRFAREFQQPGGQFLESSASPTHSSPLPRRTSFSEVNAGFWQNLYQGSYGLQG